MLFRWRPVESNVFALLGGIFFGFILLGPQRAMAEQFQIGFGRRDITPRQPVRLSGYASRTKPTTEVADSLFARAMVMTPADGADAKSVIVVSTDSICITSAITTEIFNWAQAKYQIRREQLILCSTHSHSAPHLAGGLNNLFSTPLTRAETSAMESYTKRFSTEIQEAIDLAFANRQTASVEIGDGEAGFAVNRRKLRDGKWDGFGNQKNGITDSRVRTLVVKNSTGELLGGSFLYACHCTTLGANDKVSGDWAGLAAQDLEDKFNSSVFLPIIGCGADQNPNPRSTYEQAKSHALQVVAAVSNVLLSESNTPIVSFPRSSFGYAGLASEQPSKDELKAMEQSSRSNERNWAQYMARIKKEMGRIPETYPMPIHSLQFGKQLSWVFLGGEVVLDYQLQIEKDLATDATWVAAYTDDVFAYVASEAMRSEGGYEVDSSMIYYLQPGRWQTGTQALVLRRVREIADRLQANLGGLGPEAGLHAIRVPEGFRVELVAHEPLVQDPINLAFDPDGSVWVVEMSDYPIGEPNGGRVKRLRDQDSDGELDHATVFLDGLEYPTSVFPWREGVLVIAAPDVIYARDLDGDGVADSIETMLSGLHTANPQHCANGFEMGLDGRLHLAVGHGTKQIVSHVNGVSYETHGKDIAWNPDSGEIFVVGGETQFVRSRDNYGNWFGNSNSKPMFQYVFSQGDTSERDYVGPTETHLLTPAVAPAVFPRSNTVERFNDLFAFNRFTSACSSTPVRSPSLGPFSESSALICEPVHNLVARVRLHEEGAVFAAGRFQPKSDFDFFTSIDPWCRPVRVINAPDGTLWVVDMVRQVIEHPEWIPRAWQERLDLRAGSDKGRIYRLYHKEFSPRRLQNIEASKKGILTALASEIGPVRDLGLLRLMESGVNVSAGIRESLHQRSPSGYVASLGALKASKQLTVDDVSDALRSADSRVVCYALKLLKDSTAAADLSAAKGLGDTLNEVPGRNLGLHVDLQLALLIAQNPELVSGEGLRQLIVKSGRDPWILRAFSLVDSPKTAHAIVESFLAEAEKHAGNGEDFTAETKLVERVWNRMGPQQRLGILNRYLSRAGNWTVASMTDLDWMLVGFALRESIEGEIRSQTDRVVDQLYAEIENTKSDLSLRCRLVAHLGTGLRSVQKDLAVIEGLMKPGTDSQIVDQCLARMRELPGQDVARILQENWERLRPTQKTVGVDCMLDSREGTVKLVESLESGLIHPSELTPSATQSLRQYSDRSLRARCLQVLGAPTERSVVVTEYMQQIPAPFQDESGAALFTTHCAGCHQSKADQPPIGPPLENLKHWTIQQWVSSIMHPNAVVEPKYLQTRFLTKDDRVLSGTILERNSERLLIALPDGARRELSAEAILEESATRLSLMPEGFEDKLTPRQLASLLGYLRQK